VADRNLVAGSCLAVFGALFAVGSYLVLNNVPLTALGMGLAVLGVAWALVPPNPLPREVVANLVKSSCDNIEALLEALGATERAIYLPANPHRRVVAYVPLKRAGEATLSEVVERSGRVVFRRGGSLGVIVAPPTIAAFNPSPMSERSLDALIEQALVESEIASSARAVQVGDSVVVSVRGPRVDVDSSRFKAVMGSLPACMAAQAVAWALSKPVRVVDEEREGDNLIVRLRVLDWTDKSCT